MDQSVIRTEGIVVPFLGKDAYAMKTPAILARKTGRPVLPVFIRRTGAGHLIEIGEEIPLAVSGDSEAALVQDTVNLLRTVEDFIEKYPAEWLWIHRRWKRIKEQPVR
jgi:KDO2-lipid IV(A) lauroyltransferase